MSLLAAHDVSVRRDARAILDRVSFTAEAGDFVAVIGANGAGKSTLLSVLAGLLKPDEGRVEIGGQALTQIPPRDLARQRAYLPQNPRCEWPISVERLVALGLTPHLPVFGELPPSFTPAIEKALEAGDLLTRRTQPATTLSGGELARAMLARALVGEPRILIVDEPITGLDPRHALDAARRLRDLARSGTLVVSALHDLNLVGRYASRVFALKNGRAAGMGETRAALTPELIRDVFEVEARMRGAAEDFAVDFIGV